MGTDRTRRRTIFKGTPDQAAEAATGALAEGFSAASIGEAIALAEDGSILINLD